MYEMKVLVDASGITNAYIESGKPLTETANAVKDACLFIVGVWKEHVSHTEGKTISWSGGQFVIHKRRGVYEGAIDMEYPFLGKELAGYVGPFGLKYPGILEAGFDRFDMKAKLLAGPKAKVSKKGWRYIRIPFWYEGGQARAIQEYGDIETAAKSGVAQLGGRRTGHSEWARFRTITENPKVDQSKKWIHPGLKPHPVGKAVYEATQEQVQIRIRTGMARDVARIVREARK